MKIVTYKYKKVYKHKKKYDRRKNINKRENINKEEIILNVRYAVAPSIGNLVFPEVEKPAHE